MTNALSKLGAVILAAGSGTRMGGTAKALLQTRDRRTFLASIITAVRDVGVHRIIVVLGEPHIDRVAPHVGELGATVAVNGLPERGMASSVEVGFQALKDVDAAWLWPVDHPYVKPDTLRALIAALGTHAAARPAFEGRRGHPPLIASSLFGQLAACGDVEGGARTLLAEADTIDVAVDDPGVVRDIDTPADLEAS